MFHPGLRDVAYFAVVGKYSELQDAYKSIYESLCHGGIAHQHKVEIVKVAAEDLVLAVRKILAGGRYVSASLAERFANDDAANAMLDRKRRDPWQLPKV